MSIEFEKVEFAREMVMYIDQSATEENPTRFVISNTYKAKAVPRWFVFIADVVGYEEFDKLSEAKAHVSEMAGQ